MKKVVNIALILHLILWAIFFLIAVSDRLTNEAPPGIGGLEGWFFGGIYTVLAALAAGGYYFGHFVPCCARRLISSE